MLDEGAKEALTKAMSAVKSGAMKPGDSMIMKGSAEPPSESDSGEYDAQAHLEDISADLISELSSGKGSAASVANLLREAFQCLENEPHEEGKHL